MRGFLALGDSYTIGEGVPPGDRWPDQLTARLRERGFEIGAPEIIARTAWTTDELADAIARAAPAGPFPFVTLLIGVNDQYRERAVEAFAANFTSLLEQAVRFADGIPLASSRSRFPTGRRRRSPRDAIARRSPPRSTPSMPRRAPSCSREAPRGWT